MKNTFASVIRRSWQRRSAVVAVILVMVSSTCIIPLPASILHPSVSHTSPRTNTVVDGNARFMVLTPMLVRAEYAADGNFQNGTTFNAIHRNFPIPSYTTQVVNGWREIHTADLVMRYKENSGLFSPTNFTVQLQGQAQPCTFAQGCEAEGAALSGGAVLARDHQNYTGTGFVTGYEHAGAATSWAVGGVPTAESAILAIRYANATAGNGQARARTLSLYVNGSKTGQITFPTTTNWDTWSTVQQAIHLKSGMDTVALVCDPGDGCNVNLDSIAVTYGGGSYPTEQPTLVIPDRGQAAASPCTFAQACEAENASLSGGEGVRSDHQHYTGTGFVTDSGVQGATTTWTLHDVPASANDTLTIRYANATAGNGQARARTLSLYVNGSKTGQITFPTTANWDTWTTVQQAVQLHVGDTTIALGCDSGDSCNVNIDSLTTQEICALGQICQAEQAALSHGASVSSNHQSFTGKGFVTGYEQTGATARWTVHSVPQDGDAILTIRYANFLGSDNQTTSRTLSLSINGGQASTVTFAPTMSWDSWESVTQTIHLTAGENIIALSCGSGNSCRVNLDALAITSPDSALPLMTPSNLGGWERSLDLQSDASALNNGLLSRDGWYLIDDSQTALWDTRNWPTARPSHNGAYQDGYFFGYGHHYTTALSDLAQLTGASPLLPRWAFGNWYSRYYAYKDTDYEQALLPKFRSEQVPLDALVVDTDWKSPSQWNGWNWNTSLFSDPQGFLHWAQGQGLHVTLNTHASMQGDDPQFATANRTAGGLIPNGNNNYIWDWSNQAQATSYMNLHHPFDQQGVRFWWLDWCCDASRVSMPGLNPDGWVNYLYASDATKQGLRGFAFSRMGSAYTGYTNDSYMVPSGPWSNHRTTLQFTGDTQPTWQMLSFESAFTQKEGNIGQAYVTHDIGSFAGKHLSDDLYVRWVQLGTFQPILRLHSDHGDRLPWDYDDTARIPAEQFMRLREALIPYLYTLSWQTYSAGLPMTRGLYLTYPEDPEAYTFDREYMLGDQMLVAPITSAGTTASTQVWLPPGTWTDYFTGKTYTGPSIQTITDDLTKMPVFIRAGGILPIQPYMDDSTQKSVDPLTLNVYTGADGSFSLYEDNGEGLDYQHNTYALTPISYSQRQSTIQVGAVQGRYAQQLTQRSYLINIINVATAPSSVTVNGQALSQTSSGTGWTYDANAQTVHVTVDQRSTQSALTIKLNS